MPEKISICLNMGREESVGNDDVSIVCSRKYVKTENPEGTAQVDFVTFIATLIFRYSFASRVISDILWSSFFLKL